MLTEKQRQAHEKIKAWRHDPNLFVREVFQVDPDPWQADVLGQIAQPGRKRIAMRACAGPGKMQPKCMEIYTPTGKRLFGDLQIGDMVFAMDGTSTRVNAIHDNGEREVFKVEFTDGSFTYAGNEHLWKVSGERVKRTLRKRMDKENYAVLTTKEIKDYMERKDALNVRHQFYIPKNGPVYYPKKFLPIEPYLLGVWLGNGDGRSGRITGLDEEIFTRIKYLGYEMSDQHRISRTIYGLSRQLRNLNIIGKRSYQKSIPQIYKNSSIDQRIELLRGLMDTDGCIDKDDGHCEYDTTSLDLANDVCFLIRSLGGFARIAKSRTPKYYRDVNGNKIICRVCYRVSVITPFNPFYTTKKHERWHLSEDRYLRRYIHKITLAGKMDCMCIEIEHASKCYLANDFIVTHNSAVLAWAGWHRLLCYVGKGEHPKGAAISCTADNLKDNLWAELAKWQNRSPLLQAAFAWTHSRIFAKDHPETWFLSARGYAKSADPEAVGRVLSGLHSEYPFYLIDESGDIPPQISRSAEQGLSTCVDGLIITAGNTTSQTGLLYDVCVMRADQWWVISITSDPANPKRTPRVDAEWAQKQIDTYGRDNPWVQAYIMGEFPAGGVNTLLSPDEVEAAMNRHYVEDQYNWAQKRIGIDVARFGDDITCLFPRQGLQAFRPVVMRHQRTTEIAARAAQGVAKWGAERIYVDDTGHWGHGVIDNLLAARIPALGIQFHGAPIDPRFKNKRAEMWMEMADWVKRGGALPRIPELIKELSQPTYFFNQGKIQIEDKDQLKARLGCSPDRADALALSFAEPDQPAITPIQQFARAISGKTPVLEDYDPLEARRN